MQTPPPGRADGLDRRRFLGLAGAMAASALYGCGGGGDAAPAPTPNPTPVPTPQPGLDWSGLSRRLSGRLILPADADYGLAAPVVNMRFDAVRPQAIARCASAADVAEVLAFVRANGLAVTPRCGGHGFGGYSTGTGVVIDVGPMNAIRVDAGTATIGAGAKLADVYDQLIGQGVAIPSGTCPSVGIAGITLGGGIGLVDRAYGLTCDNLLAAQVVTADGRLLDCDATREPELFWALRGGGGGNFGVVTAFTFKTHPTRDLTQFEATFRFDDAARVLAAWQAWPDGLPDAIWSYLIFSFFNPASAPVLQLSGVCIGTPDELAPHWARLLATIGAAPLGSNVVQRSYRDTMLAMCGGRTVSQCHMPGQTPDGQLQRYPFASSSDFFDRPLPAAGIEALLQAIRSAQAGGIGGQILLDAMGGALGRVAPDATAFPHRAALFSAEYYMNAALAGPAPTWSNGMRATMRPWSSGGAYVNYIDPLIADWPAAYYGANYARLVQVKAQYDPSEVFRGPQHIPAR
ncbi:FAD-binding oxidoreductase [Chitinimonas koreensis]|uniref:FAD-binding oxidoreductase n=1 Tax=Chitinimonas koreensis TaxID=356302 RepID=UPI0004132477|nr:FAD-binding oxidoreductase [Chitinimonas koreensis]